MVMTWEANDLELPKGFRTGCLELDCDINPFTRTIWRTAAEAERSWNRRANDGVGAREPEKP